MSKNKKFVFLLTIIVFLSAVSLLGANKAMAGDLCGTGSSDCSGNYSFVRAYQCLSTTNSGDNCGDLGGGEHCASLLNQTSGTCFARSNGSCGCFSVPGASIIGPCCQYYDDEFLVSKETANEIASCVGAGLSSSPVSTWLYVYPSDARQWEIGGRHSAAGIAATYNNHDKATADRMVYDSLCGTSGSSSGTGTGTGTGSGTGTGTGTITATSAQIAYVNSMMGIINNMLQNYRNILGLGNTGSFGTTGLTGATTASDAQIAYVSNLTNIVNNMTQTYRNILNTGATQTGSTPASGQAGNTATTYPATITVNASLLNIRSAPNTSASISGQLPAGSTFVATGTVKGQNVEGTDDWWVTADNTYIWAGGTRVR